MSSQSITLYTSDKVMMVVDVESIVTFVLNHYNCNGNFLKCTFKSAIISKVIEYCKFHARSDVSPGDKEDFDTMFVNEETSVLHDLFLAAYFFDIEGLKHLTRPSNEAFSAFLMDLAAKETTKKEPSVVKDQRVKEEVKEEVKELEMRKTMLTCDLGSWCGIRRTNLNRV